MKIHIKATLNKVFQTRAVFKKMFVFIKRVQLQNPSIAAISFEAEFNAKTLQCFQGFPHVSNTAVHKWIPNYLYQALLTWETLKQDGACLKQHPPFGCRVQHLCLAPVLVCLCLCSCECVSLDAKGKLLVILRCQDLQHSSSITPVGAAKLIQICWSITLVL